eukprot:CAMPEP_0114248882 /NCGR_PEP_ID=MMETSP0058-20121206/13820_1 /TAXON_ID=36894 /ORGANISM="Pyramimonas parkeae, CCMP726" /LENGTH=114 /DNA_ID=CAMNT_0001362339 /DNA_START=39 /DNA_END=380 /DNA_ORIENTATION=+
MALAQRRKGSGTDVTASKNDKQHLPLCEQEWDSERLLDAIHWLRHALSLVCGLIWGIFPFTGLPFLFGYVALNCIAVLLFYRGYLDLDPDEYGGHAILQGEGFMASIALFVLIW